MMEVITRVNIHRVAVSPPNDEMMETFLQKHLMSIKGAWESARPGDLVVHEPSTGYRMQGVFMVRLAVSASGEANEKVVGDLDRELDDYGSIPREFACPRYTPDAILHARDAEKDEFYWHNSFVPVDVTGFDFRYDTKRDTLVSVVGDRTYVFDVDAVSEFRNHADGIVYMEFSDRDYDPTCKEYHLQSLSF